MRSKALRALCDFNFSCIQIGEVHGAVVELKEESPERQQLEQLLSTTSLPPLSLIQTLCKTTQPNLAHPSPNSTPQHSPPSTPLSSGRKTVKGFRLFTFFVLVNLI